MLALVHLKEVEQRLILDAEAQRLQQRSGDRDNATERSERAARCRLRSKRIGGCAPSSTTPEQKLGRDHEHRTFHQGKGKWCKSTVESRWQSNPRGRILFVDDDPGLLRLLSIRLRAERYDVEAVESAAEALAALARFRPDLVISDLRMENMDGIALVQGDPAAAARASACCCLTAHGTIPDAVEATQSGAFGFLTKPVDKQQLLEYVERR